MITGVLNTAELNEFLIKNEVLQDKNYLYSPTYNYAHSISVIFENSTLLEIPKYFFTRFYTVHSVIMASVGLKSITKDDFKNASDLRKLDISSNSLDSLEQSIFSDLPLLMELNLANNFLISISGVFNGVSLIWNKVNLTGNRIEMITEDTFSGIDRVADIDLRSNKIKKLGKLQMKSNDSYIQNLYLSKNAIEEFKFEFDFTIKNLFLDNNQLRNLKIVSNVEHLDVSQNFLKTLKVEKTLQQINAADNDLESIDFPRDSNLNTIVVKGNRLDEATVKRTLNMSNLEFLDLSNNKVGPLNISTFSKLTKLKFLILDSTEISNIEFGTFSHQFDLQILDLSNNNLMQFDFDKFAALSNLQYINLNGNLLREIKNFQHIKKTWPKLSRIGIMQNDWNCTYLSYIMKWLNHENIRLEYGLPRELDAPNIKGIGCVDLGEENTGQQDYANVKPDVQKFLNELQDHIKANLPKFIREIRSNDTAAKESYYKLALESRTGNNDTIMVVLVSIAACTLTIYYGIKLLIFSRSQFRGNSRRHTSQSMSAIFENDS